MENLIGKTATISVDVKIIDQNGRDVRVKEKDSGDEYWIDKEGIEVD